MRKFCALFRLSLFFLLAIAVISPIIFVERLKQFGRILEARADVPGGAGGPGGDGGDGGPGGDGGDDS